MTSSHKRREREREGERERKKKKRKHNTNLSDGLSYVAQRRSWVLVQNTWVKALTCKKKIKNATAWGAGVVEPTNWGYLQKKKQWGGRKQAAGSSSSLSWLAVAAETFLLSSAALCLQFVPLLRLHNGRSNVAANGAWNIMEHYEARDWCCIVDQLCMCVCVCDAPLLKRYLLTSCICQLGASCCQKLPTFDAIRIGIITLS